MTCSVSRSLWLLGWEQTMVEREAETGLDALEATEAAGPRPGPERAGRWEAQGACLQIPHQPSPWRQPGRLPVLDFNGR